MKRIIIILFAAIILDLADHLAAGGWSPQEIDVMFNGCVFFLLAVFVCWKIETKKKKGES